MASVLPSLHVVTGTSYYNGVYEERRVPELHFKSIEADQDGDYWFLYTDSRRPNTWILGYGGSVTTARAYYRAPAVDGRPAITGWSDVKEEGDPRPGLRVVGVSREDFEAGHSRVDQNTIACRKTGKQGNRELVVGITHSWVILDENACERCNQVPYCDTGFDEVDCPAYTSPSFVYPIYCSLVVLILGVLLHLGWNCVTR